MTNLSCSMHVCFCNICTWTHSLYNCRRTYWQIKPKQRKPWSKPHLSQMLHMHVDIESGQTNILANDKETQTWKGWSLWKEHMVWFLMVLLYVSWWLTYPSEKYEFVSWDYNIPNIWKNKTCSKPPTSICLLMLACYWPLTRLSIFLKFCGHLPCQQHHLKDFREKPPEIHSPDIQGYPRIPSGKLSHMENHHRNREFSHEKWWIFPSFFVRLPEAIHGHPTQGSYRSSCPWSHSHDHTSPPNIPKIVIPKPALSI
jgi:hypothetical protein